MTFDPTTDEEAVVPAADDAVAPADETVTEEEVAEAHDAEPAESAEEAAEVIEEGDKSAE